jgi:hypothetical protein
MNTVSRINRLIGQAMTACRKATGFKRDCLALVVAWLNRARIALRKGYELTYAHNVRCADYYARLAAVA